MAKLKPSLLALLHRANQIATERFASELGDRNLTPRQIQLLATLNVNEGVSHTQLVELTGIDRSTMADMMLRLLKRGLIRRKRAKEDARAYAVHLTDDGRRVLATSLPVLERLEVSLMASFPITKRAEFLTTFERFIAANTKPGS
jgi:DNA-binding MarR family transcriptional regulator